MGAWINAGRLPWSWAAIAAGGVLFALLPGDASAQWEADEQATAAMDSTAAQPGRVLRFDGEVLELAPFNRRSDLDRFRVTPATPIYQNGSRLAVRAIHPGDDVQVDFRRTADGRAQAMAIRLLTPQQVAGARKLAEEAPPQMALAPPAVRPLAPGAAQPMTPEDQKIKQHLIATSTGSQAGEVLRADSGVLTVKPFHEAGKKTVDIAPTVPVYSGSAQVGTDSLEPGADVRVYYDATSPVTAPHATAIEILSPSETRHTEGAQPAPEPP